jgi:hypothetical protein
MSSVRMCDRCGSIFSERSDDWSTFTGTTKRRNRDSGQIETQSDTLDSCPDCTELMTSATPRPVPAIGSSVQARYERGDDS